MMGLANPLGGLALAAVAVLVLLLRLQRRTRPVRVPSLLLWRRLPARAIERRRARPDLAFWLQLAAVLALAAGLLRPWLAGRAVAAAGAPLVLVVDCSASMAVREADGTRFALARARAVAALDGLGDGVPAMLIAATARPRVAARWSADRTTVRAALAALEPLDVPDGIVPAVERASAEARARDGARVLVLTDLSPARSGLSAEALAIVDWVAVGRRGDNLAVTALAVEQPPFAGPEEAIVTATVRNFDREPHAVRLEATIDGVPWLRRELRLDPRAREPVVLDAAPRAGVLAVALADAGDALAADDRALGWIAPPAPLDLVLVSGSDATAAGVAGLAAALPGSHLEVVNPAGWRERGPGGPAQVTVFDRAVPPGEPRGAALYVAPPAGTGPCPATRTTDAAAVIDWDETHPALAGLERLEAIEVARAVVLAVPPWGRPIVQAASRQVAFPLLVAGERDGRRVACLAAELPSPLAGSDTVPLVLVVLGTLRWLAQPTVDAPLVVDTGLPRRATAVRPTDGPVRAAAGVVLAERVGAHRLAAAGRRDVLVLASLSDEAESDVGRDDPGEWPATAPLVARMPGAPHQPLAWWCWAAALALVAAEWTAWRARR